MGRFGRLVFVVGIVVLAAACHQSDTVFVVDTSNDTVDSNPGDGFCSDASGDCSLRAAVMEAGARPGVEEVRLRASATYTLTDPSAIDIVGGLVVTGDGRIEGPGFLQVLGAGVVEFDGPDFIDTRIVVDHAEAVLVLSQVEAVGPFGGFLRMYAGTAMADSSGFAENAFHMEGGSLFARNIFTYPNTRSDLAGGTIDVAFSTLRGHVFGTFGADNRLTAYASILAGSCFSFAPQSRGYNVSSSCQVGHPTDTFADPGEIFADGDGRDDTRPTGRLFGGSIETKMIAPGGPAHDAGPPTCVEVSRDARGVERPFGAACDIGATEIQPGSDCRAVGPGINLRFCDLSGRSFAGADLTGAALTMAVTGDASFDGATLRGVEWWESATASSSTFVRSTAAGADLRDASIRGRSTGFTSLVVTGADLTGARIDRISVAADDADLTRTSGSYVLYRSTGATITDADFSRAFFRPTVGGGMQGLPVAMPPGHRVIGGYFVGPMLTLTGADFSGRDFSEVDLRGIVADDVNLSGAILTSGARFAWFNRSDLDGADLSGGDFERTDFNDSSMVATQAVGASFTGAIFDGATIVGADFSDADLRNARFRDALVLWNTFDNTTCPSGMNSDANGGNCDGQFLGFNPQPPGAPVPEEFQGREAEFATFGEREPAD